MVEICKDGYLKIYDGNVSFDNEIVKYLLDKHDALYLSNETQSFIKHITPNITKLILDFYNYSDVKVNNLPSTVKELQILQNNTSKHTFNNTLDNLPYELEILYIDSNQYNQSIDKLPTTLIELSIESEHFNQSLDNLPYNLQTLNIKLPTFNQSVANLPSDLKCLFITSNTFNQSLDNLPTSLEYLEIDKIYLNYKYDFNYEYALDNLPPNLKSLTINEHYLSKTNSELLRKLYPMLEELNIIENVYPNNQQHNYMYLAFNMNECENLMEYIYTLCILFCLLGEFLTIITYYYFPPRPQININIYICLAMAILVSIVIVYKLWINKAKEIFNLN